MRELEDRRASIQPIKSKLKISILDNEDIRKINETTLRILEEIGIFLPSIKALRIFADAGANVDFDKKVVKIHSDLVVSSLKKAPRYYSLAARERAELDVKIDGESGTYFSCGGTAAHAIDFKTGQKRLSVKDDVAKMAKIADYLPIVSFFWPTVSASDKLKTSPLHELGASFNFTEKHVQTESVMDEVSAKYAIEMASVIAGGRDKLRKRPLLSICLCYIQPLAQDEGGIESALTFAEAGLPVGLMSMPTMGATAPASQAGALAMGLAEVLSGCVLTQIAYPGTPNFICIIPGVVNPHSGEYFYASAFSQVANAAATQLAHFYGIPVVNGASFGGSAYKLNSWQVGRENVYLPLLATMVGADMCFSVSLMEAVNLLQAERILFDREIFQVLTTITSGIEVNDSTLVFDMIREVGPRGHFLGQRHTVENLPRLWPPSILFKKSKIPDEKYRDPVEITREEISWILENHEVPQLEKGVQAEIARILKAADEELIQ